MNRTIIAITHYGPDPLLLDLFKSAGFTLPESILQRDASFIELPAYSFLIVNNNLHDRGFTAACNIGLKKLKNSPAEYRYVWLLNNDTWFESREHFECALEGMQAISEDHDWGIVSQQIRHFLNRDLIVFGGACECYPAGRHKRGSAGNEDYATPTQEQYVTFCSALIRRDVVESVGLMDESMHSYYSDSDYCLTARQAGFGVGYAGKNSYLFHKSEPSDGPRDTQVRVLQEDRQAFWKKWISGERHAVYLKLRSKPDGTRSWHARELRVQAAAFRELKSWLDSLDGEQKISLQDILEHFEYDWPPTDFVILCHIADEMLRKGKT